jgi:hypothetical protein
MANTLANSMPALSEAGETAVSAPAQRKFPRAVWRAVWWILCVCLVIVFAIGFLHTKLGAPLLVKLGVGCPVRAGTPEEVDRARMFGASFYAGRPQSSARPALGFVFEQTTIAEVETWAAKHGVACETINGTETLRACSQVPAIALGQPEWFGPVDEVSFAFHANRTLSIVTTMRRKLEMARANSITAELSKRLGATLGAPSVRGGENNPAHFSKGPLQAYKEEWSFGNYGAQVSEVRLANVGLMVREHYLSLVP